jgi:hypothetical protein
MGEGGRERIDTRILNCFSWCRSVRQFHATAAFPRGESLLVHTGEEAGWAVEKSVVPACGGTPIPRSFGI